MEFIIKSFYFCGGCTSGDVMASNSVFGKRMAGEMTKSFIFGGLKNKRILLLTK